VVEKALSQHENLTPKQDIMKSAMNICKGTMNPAEVRLMIDSVYDFYYSLKRD
jgi:hypothetical protein